MCLHAPPRFPRVPPKEPYYLPDVRLTLFENDASVLDKIVGTNLSEKPAMKLQIARRANAGLGSMPCIDPASTFLSGG